MFNDLRRFKLSTTRKIVLNIYLFSALLLSGNIFLLSPQINSMINPFWAPGGVALAGILIFRLQDILPSLILGFLFLSIKVRVPHFSMIGIYFVNLLEPIFAATILKGLVRLRHKDIGHKDIFTFIVIGVLLVPFVSSTFNLAFLYSGGLIDIYMDPDRWIKIFTSRALGILIITPLIMSYFFSRGKKSNRIEGAILFTVLILATYWLFEGNQVKRFLIVPFITWAALRFSYKGVGIATIIIGSIALHRSTHYMGGESLLLDVDILWVQCLTGGSAIVGYFLATVKDANDRANRKELESFINLEHKKVAEEALAILDQSIQKSPIGYSLVDRDFKFIRINEKMANLNGYSVDFHLGQTIRSMVPELAFEIESKVLEVFETGKTLLNLPVQGCTKNNPAEIIYGLQSYYPVRHPITDKIFGVAISFQDMTEQIKNRELLEQNQTRLNLAQAAGKIGAFEWDLSTNRIFWTPELEVIYDFREGEFGGFYESWLKLIHPQDIENVVKEVNDVFKNRVELNIQFRIMTKRNETRWILARGEILANQKGGKLIGINIDITDQKYSEQKLRLTETNLLHALSVRDEFMAIASHELKTPLTSLKLQTEMFQRGLDRQDDKFTTPERVAHLLRKNIKQISRLSRLVDDMLDISRMRTGKLTLKKEKCDLCQILKEIIIHTKDQFENSGAGLPILEIPDESIGEWDSLRIEQVLTNILTNSIRYGQGKSVSILIKNFSETVRISVRDQGLGITKADQKKIFQRYERGLLAREVSGLGLGLFISEQIVQAHSGLIWVESEINEGATFFVELPRTLKEEMDQTQNLESYTI